MPVDDRRDEARRLAAPATELGPGSLDAERHRLQVRVPAFQGPLDLLLHLVRINEVDVKDLPVLDIARQYDAYLETMRQLDLTIAGEFLVMAATLAHLKSRMLLPRRPSEEVDEDDPRQDLVRQLLEHQRFQLAAESLGARADRQGRTARSRHVIAPVDHGEEPAGAHGLARGAKERNGVRSFSSCKATG